MKTSQDKKELAAVEGEPQQGEAGAAKDNAGVQTSETKPPVKARKRLWAIAILLCIVAMVTGIYLTYSAFLAGDFLKSVAVSGSSQALFASDLLSGYTTQELPDNDIHTRSVIVDTKDDTCSFTFKVYNYLLGDKSRVNDKDINATISISATNAGDDWSVEGQPALGNGVSPELKFSGYVPTMYTYKVTFNKDYLNRAFFTVKVAVGANSPGTTLKWLAAKISPSERAKVTSSGVSGEWVEKGSVDNFDAYGYRITVTGTKTRVRLIWGDKVELDPHFPSNYKDGDSAVTVSGNSVTFTLDPGSQIITFYRKNGKPSSWDDIGVTCGVA